MGVGERTIVTTKPPRCPECGGRAPTYHTAGSTQYRRCRKCGHRFNSIKESRYILTNIGKPAVA